MNILCSGEVYADPISTETCLACAIESAGRQPCGYGYRLLKAIFGAFDDRSKEVHVTDLTGCLRKAYYEKTDPEPEYVHEKLILWLGIAQHAALDFTDEHVRSEVPVGGMGVVGRIDAIYEDGRIEDAKTTRWMKPSLLPYGSHEIQVNIYNALSGNGGERLQIQMIDMSGPTRCQKYVDGKKCNTVVRRIGGVIQCPRCGNVPPDGHLGAYLVEVPVDDPEAVEMFIQERGKALADALESRVPPPAEPGFLCNYCPFSQCKEHPDYF